jgi:hypothetical protein
MPKNMSGGSAHKAQRNSEGSKARNNRCLVDDLLADYEVGEKLPDIYVGRIVRRMGSGRMMVFYMNHYNQGTEQIIPMRGGLRGKGKKSVWVDVDSLVMVVETGLAGTTHEIVGVFSETQIARYKKLFPEADPRLFLKGTVETTEKPPEELFEFNNEEDVDVDAI